MAPQVNKAICYKLFFISAETVVWEQKIFSGRGQLKSMEMKTYFIRLKELFAENNMQFFIIFFFLVHSTALTLAHWVQNNCSNARIVTLDA